MEIPTLQLNSSGRNRAIPTIGLGTAATAFIESEEVKQAVLLAIEGGYRHFDTASIYKSERAVGDAVVEAVRVGHINSRDDVFITSKLWVSDAHPDRVLPALQSTLRNLKMEYVDLYLIHFPLSVTPGEEELPVKKEDLLPMDFAGVWREMEKCHTLGLAKSIGVSNFSWKKLEKLLETAKILPSVDQVEMNVFWQQKKLRDYCKNKGILVSAYSVLGGHGMPWGSSNVLDSAVIKDIARHRNKSIAQVCARWVYEQGVVIIVKSFDKVRMKENLGIFDWRLEEEDLVKIGNIPQHKTSLAPMFVSEDGPYKSLEELWDEEVL